MNIEQGLNSIIYGEAAIKLCNWGKPHIRKFFIDPEDTKYLRWISPAKAPTRSCIDIATVTSITFGFNTPLFQKHKEILKGKDELAVSINYQVKEKEVKSLNLIFLDPERMQLFITGLQFFVLKQGHGLILSQTNTRDKKFLNEIWEKNNAKEPELDLKTVRKITKELNIGVYPFYFDQQVKLLLNTDTGKLNKTDFIALIMNLAANTELAKVFRKYSKDPNEELAANTVMTIEGVKKFFNTVQKETISIEKSRSLIQVATCFLYTELGNLLTLGENEENPNIIHRLSKSKYEEMRKESELNVYKKQVSVETTRELTLLDFTKIILSRTNTVVDEADPFETDMTYPLPYYLINTSNYTYLKLNKETNELKVSAENYKKYLLKGVKCVDIELLVQFLLNIIGRKPRNTCSWL